VDSDQVENLWVKEVTLMVQELMINHMRYEEQNNPVSARIALAQALLLHKMLEGLMESEDWSDFKETVYDYIDSETERYLEAREAGDRDMATLTLARVRCAKTLARRLENPLRQLLLASTPQGDPEPGSAAGVRKSTGRYAEMMEKMKLGPDDPAAFKGTDPKGLVPQHTLVAHEISVITRETADNMERVQPLGEAAKICFISGRAQGCIYLMNSWLKLDNWSLFKDFLREFTEEAELYYRQARENDDHDRALAILGRISAARILLRRLAEPIRSRGFLSRITASVTLH
jgi:hypothetical protein